MFVPVQQYKQHVRSIALGSAVGLKASARFSDAIRCISCELQLCCCIADVRGGSFNISYHVPRGSRKWIGFAVARNKEDCPSHPRVLESDRTPAFVLLLLLLLLRLLRASAAGASAAAAALFVGSARFFFFPLTLLRKL